MAEPVGGNPRPVGSHTVRLAFEGAATKFSNRDSPEYLPDEAF
jgi:hypothetical protein